MGRNGNRGTVADAIASLGTECRRKEKLISDTASTMEEHGFPSFKQGGIVYGHIADEIDRILR